MTRGAAGPRRRSAGAQRGEGRRRRWRHCGTAAPRRRDAVAPRRRRAAGPWGHAAAAPRRRSTSPHGDIFERASGQHDWRAKSWDTSEQ